MTKLYFHNATSSVTGTLPSTQQSALGAPGTASDAVSVNRSMNTTIGTTQTSKAVTISSGAQKIYFTRFVSDILQSNTTISANTWNLAFAVSEPLLTANFPCSGSGATVNVTCYVWRPSNGTKVGNIRDGTSAASFNEPSAASTEKSLFGTFAGSAVTAIAGDVICYEVYFSVSGTQASTDTFFYDGTTETNNNGTTVSSHASYIETPQTLTFGAAGNNVVRALTTETISISESSLVVKRDKARLLSTETVTITEPVKTILAAKARALATQTITITEPSLPVRVRNKSRAPATETVTVTAGTLVRLAAKIRVLATQTVTITEPSLAKVRNKPRAPATEIVTVTAGTAARLTARVRVLGTQTVAITEVSLLRLAAKVRVLGTQTVTITEVSLLRLAAKIRALATQTVAITEPSLPTRVRNKPRTPATQTVTITENLARLTAKIRALATQTVAIAEAVARQKTTGQQNIVRTMTLETIAVTSTLTRLSAKLRALATETVAKSESVTRLKARQIALPTQSTTVTAGTLTRLASKIKTVSAGIAGIVTTSESLVRLLSKIRTASDTVTKGENLAKSLAKIRATTTESVTVTSGTLTRLLAKIRAMTATESVTITESIVIVSGTAIKHIVRIIGEIPIVISDLFYKARALATEIVAVTGLVDKLVTDNTPTLYTKTLTDTSVVGPGILVRQSAKLKPLSDVSGIIETLVITRRNKNRVNAETITITGGVTQFKPLRHIILALTDSVNTSDINSRISGKVRRVGGPG